MHTNTKNTYNSRLFSDILQINVAKNKRSGTIVLTTVSAVVLYVQSATL